MSLIHKTATLIRDPKEGGGPIKLGDNVTIGPNCVIIGPAVLGDEVELSTGVVIGEEAETYHRNSDFARPVVIGAGSILREHVVVQRGLTTSNRCTEIGENCYIMHGTHVAHDVHLYEGVTTSPYVVLGGHTTVLPWTTLGIQSSTHQWVTIGAYAMVGMHAAVIHDAPPCCTVVGVPARVTGVNSIGLERHKERGAPVPAMIIWEEHGPSPKAGSRAEDLWEEWKALGKRPWIKRT